MRTMVQISAWVRLLPIICGYQPELTSVVHLASLTELLTSEGAATPLPFPFIPLPIVDYLSLPFLVHNGSSGPRIVFSASFRPHCVRRSYPCAISTSLTASYRRQRRGIQAQSQIRTSGPEYDFPIASSSKEKS